MTQYEVTEGTVRVRLSPKERRDFFRGFIISDGDVVAQALGKHELQRLVTQGCLKVIGLQAGLEKGTIVPNHRALPSDVRTDESGKVISAREAKVPQLVLPPRDLNAPTIGSVREQVDQFDATDPRSAAYAAVHGAPSDGGKVSVVIKDNPLAVELPSPGTPAGKWNLDPARVESMSIDQLNALIQDRDPDAPVFGAGEEPDARAFVTSDFAVAQAVKAQRAANKGKPSASGDAALPDTTGARAVRMT